MCCIFLSGQPVPHLLPGGYSLGINPLVRGWPVGLIGNIVRLYNENTRSEISFLVELYNIDAH